MLDAVPPPDDTSGLSRAIPESLRLAVTREFGQMYGTLPEGDEQKLNFVRRMHAALKHGLGAVAERLPSSKSCVIRMPNRVCPDAPPTHKELRFVARACASSGESAQKTSPPSQA